MSVTPITSSTQYKEIIDGSKPVVIYFTAVWCGPGKRISPVLEELSNDPENSGVDFYKVDVDELPDVAESVGITAMPTFIHFKRGARLTDMVGANEKQLKQFVQKANPH